MKNQKDNTTIEFSTPDGRTIGPIQAKEFNERIKEGLKKMERARATNTEHDEKPEYWHDPQLDEIGLSLIRKHHNHLLEAEICYRVTSKPMSRAGKAIAGKARKASGLLKHFAESDFIIIVSDVFWEEMDTARRRALVDHELSHCLVEHDKDGNRSWITVGHDIEEFTAIIERHGLWHDGLKTFGQAVGRQLELGLERSEKKSEAKAAPLQ